MRGNRWIVGLLLLAAGGYVGYAILDAPTVEAPSRQSVAPDSTRRQPQGHPQGHVYTCATNEPENLNPFTIEGNVELRYVLAYTHDTLMDLDPRTGALRPALARSVEWDADGMSFVVELRDDVQFVDGTPMSLQDVLFTWQVARTEGAILGSIHDGLGLVRDVEPLADGSFRVLLKERHHDAMLAVTRAWIVCKRLHFLDEVARRAAGTPPAPGEPGFGDLLAQVQTSGPGTGPYQLAQAGDWRRARDLRLSRNPTSWRRRAYPGCWNLDGIRLLFGRDPAVRFTQLLQRKVDWFMGTDLDQVLADHPDLAKDYRIVDFDFLNLGYFLVQWNHRRPATADARVRRALGMLFDRQAIADQLLGGAACPAVSPFKPGTPLYPDSAPLPFDPRAAGQLLREAGHDASQPLTITLLAPEGNPLFRRILELARGAARQIGVELRANSLAYPTFLAALDQPDAWDGAILYQEHHTWVDPYGVFHSQGGGNRMGYADPEVDDLLERARAALDETERQRLYARFQAILERDQPATLLVHPRIRMLFNSHIQDAEPGPLGMFPERWWVPTEFQRN